MKLETNFNLGDTVYFTYDNKEVSSGTIYEITYYLSNKKEILCDYILIYGNSHTERFRETRLFKTKNEVIRLMIKNLESKLEV